ncbi:MAG TPA: hypothetical protein VGO28_07425 [Acidimicrobiia bacterium]
MTEKTGRTETVASYPTMRQQAAVVGVARARSASAFACAMPTNGSWSTMPSLGVTTIDHKHGRPRRLRVTSP